MRNCLQETLELRLKMQTDTLSFSRSINLPEEKKQLLAVTSFEAANCVSNTTGENRSFSIPTPEQRCLGGGVENIDKLFKIIELRSENDIEINVKQNEKRSFRRGKEN